MVKRSYLEGANPYASDIAKEYFVKGWWQNMTYGDVLQLSAERYPDKVAVVGEQGQWTFAQVKEKVDRFAIALHELGFQAQDRIVIQMPNRYEFLIAYYSMHMIGAVPVLAIPRHEYREISHLFRRTEPKGWILPLRDGSREFMPLIDRIRAEAGSLRHLIVLEDGGALPSGALSMHNLIERVHLHDYPNDYLRQYRPDPDDVATIFPTGGTTGVPKEVPRTHNSFLACIRYVNKTMTPGDVAGLATPIGHTMAQNGVVGGSIMKGATLVMISVPRAANIMEAVQRNKITVLDLVPTQLEDVLNAPDLEKYDLSSLRRVVTAGAALRPETVTKAREFFTRKSCGFAGAAYGSTEGPNAMHTPEEPDSTFHKSIGKPICEGDHWKIIDEDERDLPPDIEGEIAVKGPLIFTGYYKSENENKKIFTRDGYYKTGDLGKIDKDDFMFVTGRSKDIIERGGEAVIPSEIESLLDRHPSIQSSAVVAMPDPRLGEKACAYIVLKPGRTLCFDEACDFLKSLGAGKLLLPERLEIVDELPVTAIGKIDKKALRRSIEEKVKSEAPYRAVP